LDQLRQPVHEAAIAWRGDKFNSTTTTDVLQLHISNTLRRHLSYYPHAELANMVTGMLAEGRYGGVLPAPGAYHA
jgi:hypothetical protein